MSVTIFTIAMSVLWSSLIITAAHFLRKKPAFLRRVGVPGILLFYLLSIGRMVLPVEFSFVVEVPLRSWYSQVVEALCLEDAQVGSAAWMWTNLLALCWLAVGAVLLAVFAGRYLRSVKRLTRLSKERDAAAEGILREIRAEKGRGPVLRVYRCPVVDTPMGIGVFRKKILLPNGDFARQELRYILLHEYTHFLNRDLWVKMLTQVYCCLFWWNPLVYLLRRDVAQILEIKCDLAVTKGYSNEQKVEYLQTIVGVLKGSKARRRADSCSVATCMLKSADSLSLVERFQLVSDEIRPFPGMRAILHATALCLMVVSYLFVIQPAYDPDEEDIYTNDSVYVPDLGETYLIKHEDGSYSFVSEDGIQIVLDEAAAEKLVSAEIKVVEE